MFLDVLCGALLKIIPKGNDMFNRLKVKSAALAAASLGFVGSAFADLPSEATGAITAVQTDGLAMISAGWPVVAAITGGLILIKLFKKVMGKVS